MAHNLLVPAYHCRCRSARPAMDIVLTRIQPKTFLQSSCISALSSPCIAALLHVWQNSGDFQPGLYLGCPWWIVIAGLRRKRWLGQKGRDKDILKHMLVERELDN